MKVNIIKNFLPFQIFIIVFFSGTIQAELNYRIQNKGELLRLPKYCYGTQQIREISGDPIPIETYIKKYGAEYNHLHHYCWSLNQEYQAQSMSDRTVARGWLDIAVSGCDYVLERVKNEKFIFLPEIYVTKSRILFQLDKNSDAVITLKKAIEIRPNYTPAYARLSDYYAEKGDTAEAIKILKEGIAHSKKADMLNRRLKELQSSKTDQTESSQTR